MKRILILTGRYLPGYKDGGPVRTIKNLTDALGDKYHFTVACLDRDHGDMKPYDGIKINDINKVGKADVFYVGEAGYTDDTILKLVEDNDIIYICGPYNDYAIKTLKLNRKGKINKPVVLAPMGSFSRGALAIKSVKKKIFLTMFRTLGMFNNISFSVTSEVEKKELLEILHVNNRCFIAEDPQRLPDENRVHGEYKKSDRLNVVFISRICTKKNLLGAIEILKEVSGQVTFHIYGNKEDEDYYNICCSKLNELPENIDWKYFGEADSESIPEIFGKYDVFLFPTYGENFGHVISEALSSGTIPVISDTTPWLDLDKKGVGFVIPLDNKEEFVRIVDSLCEMSVEDISDISENARRYYLNKYKEASENNGYVKMFEEL